MLFIFQTHDQVYVDMKYDNGFTIPLFEKCSASNNDVSLIQQNLRKEKRKRLEIFPFLWKE